MNMAEAENIVIPVEWVDVAVEAGVTMPVSDWEPATQEQVFPAWRPDRVFDAGGTLSGVMAMERLGMENIESLESSQVEGDQATCTPSDHYGLRVAFSLP